MMSANTVHNSDINAKKHLFGFSRWSLTLNPGRLRSQTLRSSSLLSDVAALGKNGADHGSLLSPDDATNE